METTQSSWMSFDEHYLYQTALYNGLTDTTFADTGVINCDFDGNKVGMTELALKITPGLDLILPGELSVVVWQQSPRLSRYRSHSQTSTK